MISLPGYTLSTVLHDGLSTLILQGYRNADQVPVVAKLSRSDLPRPRDDADVLHVLAEDRVDHGLRPLDGPTLRVLVGIGVDGRDHQQRVLAPRTGRGVIGPPQPAADDHDLLIEQARVTVSEKFFRLRDTDAPLGQVTFSAGIASTTSNPEQALQDADKALYEAKSSGRNRTIIAS